MSPKLDCEIHRNALKERTEVARRLVSATEKPIPASEATEGQPLDTDISRETRGLAIVLLYAAYENLLKSLCRSILEEASKSRAKAQRLKPGLRLFLAHGELAGLLDSGRKKLWKNSGGLRVVSALSERPARDLNMNLFPDDGSFMKASQVAVFCEVFDLGRPASVLGEAWDRIETIVRQRNAIAHGAQTPEEIGRSYSHTEMLNLITLWNDRWTDFLNWTEASCQTSTFYLRQNR